MEISGPFLDGAALEICQQLCKEVKLASRGLKPIISGNAVLKLIILVV